MTATNAFRELTPKPIGVGTPCRITVHGATGTGWRSDVSTGFSKRRRDKLAKAAAKANKAATTRAINSA